MSAPATVRVQDVSKAFGDNVVLDRLDLEVDDGEVLALLGPSGTGKTTLLRLLAGFESADRGEVWVPERRTTVYQEPRLVDAHRVWRNVLLGLPANRSNRDRAHEILAEVGLADHARAWPATLSGGQAQRVALARALVRQPQLMLLDEPFAALDALTRIRMHTLLDELRARHRPTIVMVTHDVEEAVRLADRIVILDRGRIEVDRRVVPPHPRRPTDPDVVQLRSELLGELGVAS